MESATGAQHLGCISLQEKSRLLFLLLPLTSNSPAPLFYVCGLLVCKATTGIMVCQGNAGGLMTRGLGSPLLLTFWRCWEPWLGLGSAQPEWTISHCHWEGRKQGAAELAQSPGCTVRFTQLCCSQCKYGQPHSSPASLPQHTSRGEG